MSKYAVIITPASGRNWSGHVPDLPGCIATGKTREDCEKVLSQAIEFHIEGLRLVGESVPQPSTFAAMMEVVM